VARRSTEHPGFPHLVEHIGEPLARAGRLAIRTEIPWSLGQARKQRALLQGELLRRLAEIAARRHLDAPGTASEIDGIEVDFEDLVLAERGFDARRDDHLADLAFIAWFVAHREVL